MQARDIAPPDDGEKEPYYRQEDRADSETGIDPTIWLGIGDRFIFPILDQYGVIRATEMARVLRYLPKPKLWQVDMVKFEIIREHLDDVPQTITMTVYELTTIIRQSCQRYEFRRPSMRQVREILAEERRKQLVLVD